MISTHLLELVVGFHILGLGGGDCMILGSDDVNGDPLSLAGGGVIATILLVYTLSSYNPLLYLHRNKYHTHSSKNQDLDMS